MAVLREHLARALRDLEEGGPLAVAVSGGIDSVVLVRLLHALDRVGVVLHVHHGLRPEADEDAAFVEALAQALGVPHETLSVEVAGGNRQAAAREARYAALAEATRRHGLETVAAAHTATDQAETVLMHLVRGAGLRGLSGMAPRRPLDAHVALVRPLLGVSRERVEAEARREGWTWREDPSNAGDAYRRNRLRHHALPLLEAEGGAQTVERIAAAAAAARAALPNLDDYGDEAEQWLALDRLRAVPEAWRAAVWTEALAAWAPDVPRNDEVLRQLDALLDAPPGRRVPLGRLTAWRDRDAIRVVAPAPEVHETVEMGRPVTTPLGQLDIALQDPTAPASVPDRPRASRSCLLDGDALDGDVTLRTWQHGDRIDPRGVRGSKLVSDVLTDRRVPSSQRDRQLVLCVDDRVAWVLGHRLAEWAEASPASRLVVRATWTPTEPVRGSDARP